MAENANRYGTYQSIAGRRPDIHVRCLTSVEFTEYGTHGRSLDSRVERSGRIHPNRWQHDEVMRTGDSQETRCASRQNVFMYVSTKASGPKK